MFYVKNKNRKTAVTSFLAIAGVLTLIGWLGQPAGFVHSVVAQSATNSPNINQINISASLFGTDNRIIPNGEYEVRFAIYPNDRTSPDPYPSSSDNPLWQEVQTVEVSNGIFRAWLGVETPLPESVRFNEGQYYLGIRIGTDSEMVPRKSLASVPSAVNAQFLDGRSVGTEAGNIAFYDDDGVIALENLPEETSFLGEVIELEDEVDGVLQISNGGTGLDTTPGNGQILIGNGSEYVLGTLSGASITADSLNFTELADLLTVDATTDIALATGIDLTTSGAGAISFGNTGLFTVAGATTINNTLNVTGATTLGSTLTVGTAGGFEVDGDGDIVKINGLDYTWPGAHLANTALSNDGNGNLTWATIGSIAVTDDSLDFVDFVDAMNLDASTDIALGAFELSTSGAGTVNFANTGTFTVAGNIDFNGTSNDIAGTLNLSGNALTSSGALTITPASGSNLNISLATTGDFAVNTDDLYVDTSTGRVGIGTTTPAQALEVVNLSGTTSTAIGIYNSESNSLNNGNETANLIFYLEAQGDGKRQAGLIRTGKMQEWTSANSSQDSYLSFSVTQNQSTVVEALRIIDSGFIGIGTTAPGQKLQISGGNLSIDTDQAIYFAGPSDTNWRIGRNIGAFTKSLASSNSLDIAMANSVLEGIAFGVNGGASVFELDSAGTAFFSGNLDVNGSAHDIAGTLNLSGNALTSSGALTITPASGSNLNISLATTGDFAVNTDDLYVDTSTGNVGIGTASSLSAQLTIEDSSANTSFGSITPTLSLRNSLPFDDNFVSLSFESINISAAPQSAARITTQVTDHIDVAGDLVFETTSGGTAGLEERMRILSSGNIGIGTATPEVKLDIVSSSAAAQIRLSDSISDNVQKNTYITLRHYDTAEEDITAIIATGGASANTIRFGGGGSALNAATELQFYTASSNTALEGTQRMTIASNGRVGIGDTTPAAHLVVGSDAGAGVANGTGDAYIQNDLEVDGTIYGAGLNISGTTTLTGNLLPGADDTYDLGSSSFRWRDLYLGPTSLHIYCSAAECTSARDWAFGVQETDGTDEGNLRFTLGGSDLVNLTPSGNFGIGTTTPSGKFEISGSAADVIATLTATDATYDPVMKFRTGASPAVAFTLGVDNDDSDKFKIFAGDGLSGDQFTVDSSGVTSIANLNIGAQSFDADAGIVSWIDMPVTSSAADGTVEGYTAQLDGNAMLTIYGLSDGAGGVDTLGVGIMNTAPTAALDVTGDIKASTTITSATGFLAPENTANVYSFTGATTSGFGRENSNLSFVLANARNLAVSATAVKVASGINFGFTATSNAVTGAIDTILARDAAGILAQRNGTNAQEFRIYNTDGASDDEFVSMGFQNNSNVFTIETEETGSGTVRNIALMGGNVGIGTASPGANLHVSNSASAASSGQEVLRLTATHGAATVGSGAKLVFTHSTTPSAAIQSYTFGSSLSGLGFQTGWNALTTKMVIDNSGNVGIGTTAPSSKFEVSGSGADVIATLTASDATYDPVMKFRTGASPAVAFTLGVDNDDSDKFKIFAGDGLSGEHFSIDTSGVTSIANLELGAQTFETDAGSVTWVDMPVTASATDGTVEAYTAMLDGNPMLTIYGLSDGAGGVDTLGVGIRNDSPTEALDVTGSVKASTSVITPSIVTASGALDITPAAGSNVNINLSTTGDFAVNTSQLYVDTSTGRVSIGDTTPNNTFTVGANSQFQVNSSGVIAQAAGITSSGTITFSGLSVAGIVTNTSGGVLGTTSAVDVTLGGTGTSTAFTQGSIVFAGASGIYSQDNANFFWDDTSNGLGIGTSSADRRLEVLDASNPQMRLSHTDASVYADFQVDSNGDLIVGVDGTTNQLVLDNGGNVGIGTAAPGEELTVSKDQDSATYLQVTNSNAVGTSALAGTRFFASTAEVYALAHGAGRTVTRYGVTVANYGELLVSAGSGLLIGTGTNAAPIIFGTNSLERMRIGSDGYVGIGTTSAASLLELSGTGADVVATLTAADATYDPVLKFRTGASPAVRFSLGVDQSDSNRFKISSGDGLSGDAFAIDSTGVTTISNLQLGAQSFETDAGIVSWIDMPVTSASADGTVMRYTAMLDGNPMLTVYGLSDGAGGVDTTRVGIGTTSPGTTLDVRSASVGADISIRAINTDNTNAASNAGLLATAGGASAGDPFVQFTISGVTSWTMGLDNSDSDKFKISSASSLGSNDRFTIDSAGSVGIGTISPGAKLDVRDGNFIMSDADVAHGITDQTATTTFFKIAPGTGAAGGALLDGFSDTSAASNPMYIRGFFGETDPTDTTAAIVLDGTKRTGTSSTALGSSETVLEVVNGGATSTALLTILGGGNVGIGTTTPQAKLHVAGNIIAEEDDKIGFRYSSGDPGPYQYMTANGNTELGFYNLYTGSGTAKAFSFYGSGPAERVTILNGGNVGIGKTDPGHKLDVDGAINISSSSAYKINGVTILTYSGTGNYFLGGGGDPANTGTHNVGVGSSALISTTAGSANTAIGSNTLTLNTGSNNTAVGFGAGAAITSGSNNITIGYLAAVPDGTASNQIRIGNDTITYAGVEVAWTVTSDESLKSDIKESPLGLEFIASLKPVDYVRKNDASGKRELGLIAQDLEQSLLAHNYTDGGILSSDSKGIKSVRYNDLFAPLIKSVQELNTQNTEQDVLIAELDLRTAENITTIGELQASVDEQLVVVSGTLNEHAEFLANDQAAIETLQDEVSTLAMDVAGLSAEQALHAGKIELLETQMATLIEFYTALDLGGVITRDVDGNVDLQGGKLTIGTLETTGIRVVNADEDAPTIGTVTILPVVNDIDEDGIDDETGADGRTATVMTEAMISMENGSRIFTNFKNNPGAFSWVEKIVTEAGEYVGFRVLLSAPVAEAVELDWWLIEQSPSE